MSHLLPDSSRSTLQSPDAASEYYSKWRQVTVSLVQQYIQPPEMVILCVIPATSDFGNAEALEFNSDNSFEASLQVIKLAKQYDPDGQRTLGVITKCDDAASVEAPDLRKKAGQR